MTGIDRDGADVQCGLFAVQVKLRKSLPDWLGQWLGGIVGSAKVDGKIGILVLRKPRQRDGEALVVLRFDDFVSLHGDPRGAVSGE